MPQGFVRTLNLLESSTGTSDANILDNLGISPVSDDIRLFAGNLRNTAVLPANTYITSGNTIVIDSDGYIPFSNRTVVIHDNDTYTVTESNALDSFKLLDSGNNYFVPTQDLVRSNAVLFENFENLKPVRLETIVDVGADEDLEGDEINYDSVLDERTISQNLDFFENAQNSFFYKKSRIPISNEDASFDKEIVFSGAVRITNDQEVAQSNTSPGIFILSGQNAVRGFSDTSNPWSAANSTLETTADKASVQTLVLNDPDFIDSSANTESGDVNTDFTHKLKVTVNNETYFIMMKST